MTRIYEFLISLAIVVVAFVVIGFLLPSSRHIEQSVETNRRLPIVFDTLNSFARFTDWNMTPLRDPQMDIRISGPASGEGARLDYDSDEIGKGSWEIVESVPGKSVTIALEDEEYGENKRTTYTLEPTGRNNRNVRITQRYDVDYGMNLIGRYAGMYVTSGPGEQMKMSLTRLSNMLAAVPNYDYNELSKDDPDAVPRLVERPAANLLVAGATVERNNEVVQRTMNSNLQWIEKVMKANGLEAAGPVRIVTNEFGSENYSFEVVQPVRRAGEGDEADEGGEQVAEAGDDADGEAAETATASATSQAPAVRLEDLEMEGPVEYVFQEPARVAMVPFKGHMATLPRVRDALRAWVLTQGHETTDRPYEAWLAGIDDSFTENGEFEVYWAIR